MHESTLITFVCYFVFLLAIGLYFYRRSKSIEDYLLGGRCMGSWVTALSAQASDMSGWLLMGLPGAIYVNGTPEIWIIFGLLVGTFINWKFIAARLRVYTQQTNTITLPSFFESRFKDPTGLLRVISAMIILIFFTVYASAGLKGSGLLFEFMFENVSYRQGVLIGAAVIIVYTCLGGFLAVCWTDFFQGIFMFAAVLVVPVLAYDQVSGWDAITLAMQSQGISTSLIPYGKGIPLLIVCSSLAWGLGYFGQPHILTRFMAAKSLLVLSRSMIIAMIWVVVSLVGATMIGFVGIAMYDQPPMGDAEKVLIAMIADLFNPWIGGILLAAILSAIMSTIDSQLLVSSAALTEDFYHKMIKRQASPRQTMVAGRLCVALISLIAMILAMNPQSSLLEVVAYAWGGFGAAFGPLVLFACFSRRTTWQAALAGMVAGTVALIVWKASGYGDRLYELIPGFMANVITIFVFNLCIRRQNPAIEGQFESFEKELQAQRRGSE